MPTKRNRAGNQQNYVEAGHGDASGEYGDNATGSNKHIQFTSFKKPKDELGVEIKSDGATSVQAKPKYDGKGNESLISSISDRISSRGKLTPNGKSLVEQIKGADDELSGVIGDYYKQNPNVEIKMGKNLNSMYAYAWGGRIRKIQLGNEAINTDNNYSKGGAFFHESGHALDYTFEREHRTWSNSYKSEKYGKTISEMIQEEIKNADYNQLFNDYKEKQSSYNTPEFQELKKREEELENLTMAVGKQAMNSPKVLEIQAKLDEVRKNRCEAFRQGKYEEMRKYQNEVNALNDEYGKEYQNALPENYKSLVEEKKKISNEIYDRQAKARCEANRVYGDLSDMCQASLGKRFGMGHNDSYFKGRESDVNRGTEAFAEIMSAKATNPDSLKVMQKYIPKTLEIFDEIIGKIKGV